MSDFDEEAEREKLREKYERDKQKREATEQMSELLLKGATMTNSHCGTCGDPIFRYEGQEFCPTCEEVVAEAPADTEPEAPGDTEAEEPGEQPQQQPDATARTKQEPAPVENGSEGASTGIDPDSTSSPPETTASGTQSPPVEQSRTDTQPGASSQEPSVPGGDAEPATDNTPTDTPTSSAGTDATSGADRSGNLGTARASLTRTVTRLARQAEAADDLERARAYLAATEEAADALEAVKRADR